MEIFYDPDDMLYVFESLYNDILDDHSPLKYAHVRGNQVSYMNNQWCAAIRQRNCLWRGFERERTDTNYDLYKAQRNKCTSLRRKAINRQIGTIPEPGRFLENDRPFLHSRSAHQTNDIILKEDDTFINEKKVLAELFNGYFVNILGDAGETAIKMDHKALQNGDRKKETFRFEPVNSSQVEKLLSSMWTYVTSEAT